MLVKEAFMAGPWKDEHPHALELAKEVAAFSGPELARFFSELSAHLDKRGENAVLYAEKKVIAVVAVRIENMVEESRLSLLKLKK